MVFISIVLALCLQWCFPRLVLDVGSGFGWYYKQLTSRFDLTGLHPWLSVIVLLLPPWIAILIVLMLVRWLFGDVIYWLLVLALTFFCIDFRQPSERSLSGGLTFAQIDSTFSPVFWFAVLSIPLLILMPVLRHGRAFCLTDERHSAVAEHCANLLKLLAWLPSRLVVLASAVVGNFSEVMRKAKDYWFESPFVQRDTLPCQLPSSESASSTEGDAFSGYLRSQFFRVLVVWLVVMGVFTLGHWIAQ